MLERFVFVLLVGWLVVFCLFCFVTMLGLRVIREGRMDVSMAESERAN